MRYDDKNMRSEKAHFPTPPKRYFFLIAGWSLLVGTVLCLSGAPFWTFHIAPLSMAPLLVSALRAMDKAEGQPQLKRKSPRPTEPTRGLKA
jgi:hypothetical protein